MGLKGPDTLIEWRDPLSQLEHKYGIRLYVRPNAARLDFQENGDKSVKGSHFPLATI